MLCVDVFPLFLLLFGTPLREYNPVYYLFLSCLCVHFIFFVASDKQTLLNNDQLYQVSEYEMKETLPVSSGKI